MVNFTKFPNWLIDGLMSEVSHSEWKVITAICRMTYGWGKQRDKISLSQFEDITGLSRMQISRCLTSLEERGKITKTPSGNTFFYEISAPSHDVTSNTMLLPDDVDSNTTLPIEAENSNTMLPSHDVTSNTMLLPDDQNGNTMLPASNTMLPEIVTPCYPQKKERNNPNKFIIKESTQPTNNLAPFIDNIRQTATGGGEKTNSSFINEKPQTETTETDDLKFYQTLRSILQDWAIVTGYFPRTQNDEEAEYLAVRSLYDHFSGDVDKLLEVAKKELRAYVSETGFSIKRLSAVAPRILVSADGMRKKSEHERIAMQAPPKPAPPEPPRSNLTTEQIMEKSANVLERFPWMREHMEQRQRAEANGGANGEGRRERLERLGRRRRREAWANGD